MSWWRQEVDAHPFPPWMDDLLEQVMSLCGLREEDRLPSLDKKSKKLFSSIDSIEILCYSRGILKLNISSVVDRQALGFCDGSLSN